MRGQVSMRYSQKRWLFFTWTLIPWNFLTLFPAGAVTQVRGRQNRFMGEKYTTSVPHPSVSIVKNWECIRDMYSAINAPTIPTYLLMDSIPSSFPIWKHLQREEGKGKQVKNGRKKERSGRKKVETVNQRGKMIESTTPGGYSEDWWMSPRSALPTKVRGCGSRNKTQHCPAAASFS